MTMISGEKSNNRLISDFSLSKLYLRIIVYGRIALLSLFAFLFTAIELLSVNSVVLISGIVQEDQRGLPVGAKITFIGSNGKKTSFNSNSSDGAYQQVINSGDKYDIYIDGYILADHQSVLDIPLKNEFTEITMNFTVKKLETGLELCNVKAFEPNDSVLVESLLTPFNEVKVLMKNNLGLGIAITVSSADSYFATKTTKELIPSKSKKKSYKYVKHSTEEQLRSLVDARIRALKEYFQKLKIRETNLEFIPDIKVVKPKVTKKSKKSKNVPPEPPVPNVTVSVSKLMKL